MHEAFSQTQTEPSHSRFINGFRLGDSIEQATIDIGSNEFPIAVQASNDIRDKVVHMEKVIQLDRQTGLLNQATWVNDLKESLENLTPEQHIMVYVADLDGFKSVNDKFGHEAGDEVLKIASTSFKHVFKRSTDGIAHGERSQKNDGIARLGGDEFAVSVVKNINQNKNRQSESEYEMKVQIDKVNATFKSLLTDTIFANSGLNLSVGSAINEDSDTAETLFARADTNMFKAKYQNKLGAITESDYHQIVEVVKFLDSIGARVDNWLRIACATSLK